MEKSSVMQLPEIDDFNEEDLKNENLINNLRNLLIEKATKVVNNTILKIYITPQEIKENIEKYAKYIKVKKGLGYVGDPEYSWDTVYLSPQFFSKPIKDIGYQNSDLYKYPELIKLLEIVGLTTAVSNTSEDYCFIMGTNEKKNIFIKNLIANYFATNYDKKETRDVNFAGRRFTSYSVSNCLQVNMIYVLASIIGENTLAEALVSDKTETIIKEKIDTVTNKKGLGEAFINSLINLNIYSKKLMVYESIFEKDIEFYQEKIAPLIEALKKQNKKMQTFITTFLEHNNYDIEDYQFHHGSIKGLDITFNQEDIEFIQYLSKRFSEHCEQARNGEITFIDFFYTETPEVCPRDNTWYEDDFTFINKVVTEIYVDNYLYKKAVNSLDNATTNIINLLSEKIIPHAMKNKSLNLTPEEFNTMLSFMTYENSNIDRSKKGLKQVQKVKKQITKQTKKH